MATEPNIRVEGSWADLATRGFVVVRDLFSGDELERLALSHRRAHPTDVALYRAGEAAPGDIAGAARKIAGLLPEIRRAAGMLTDTVVPQGIFFDTRQMNLGWHSDQKSDYLFQGHAHHLSFWTPIEKPDPVRSGLAVVPMDRLRDRLPEVFRRIVGRGSARFERGVFCYEDDTADRQLACAVDLDEIAESPLLAPGDTLVFRSDVLHRTADVETPRVAFSLRALWGGHRLTATKLLGGSAAKRARILGEPNAFCEALAAFVLRGRRSITVRELLETRARLAEKELLPRVAFAGARVLLPGLLAAGRLPRGAPSL